MSFAATSAAAISPSTKYLPDRRLGSVFNSAIGIFAKWLSRSAMLHSLNSGGRPNYLGHIVGAIPDELVPRGQLCR